MVKGASGAAGFPAAEFLPDGLQVSFEVFLKFVAELIETVLTVSSSLCFPVRTRSSSASLAHYLSCFSRRSLLSELLFLSNSSSAVARASL
jgi:hypothetical protein